MLIPPFILRRLVSVQPTGVLHIGAHLAEEGAVYDAFGWHPITWIEALPEKADALRLLRPTDRVIEAVIDEVEEPRDFFEASNGESSSLLSLGDHASLYPHIVVKKTISCVTTRIDALTIQDSEKDFVMIDIQGNELRALRSFGKSLSGTRWIYSEVNRREIYRDCSLVSELDAYLADFGFSRVITSWTIDGWGDGLYVRNDVKVPSLQALWYKFLVLPSVVNLGLRMFASKFKRKTIG